MSRVALKGLLGRKMRAALTAVAIVLGVAMVSGTYVLTDTIKAAFSTVFGTVYKNTDAVITGKSAIGSNNNNNGANQTPSLPGSLLTRVQQLPGVLQATGGVSDEARLIGHDDKVIARGGAPGLAFSYTPGGQRFNPLTLTSGNWPAGSNEIDIDSATASKSHYAVGQTIGVIAKGPVQQFKVAGIVKIAGVSSLGGATIAVFTLPTAQQLFHKTGRYDTINVAARKGVTPTQVVNQIRPLLPASAQVRTGQAQAQQASKDTSGFLTIIQDFLLAFGGIALFVGSFVIANTLSITIAQRTRELATMRTLGATRRQVLRSVMLEALVIGTLASVVGLFLGLLLAKGLNQLFVSFGIDLPQASTVFATRTIIVSLAVGILITLAAALRPAIRSTRVPPIAAVREGAVLPPTRFAKLGSYPAGGVLLGALALMLVGLFVSGLSTGTRLLAIGIGTLLLFLGVAMLAPRLVPPLAGVLGWPAARLGGAAGSLARSNATRNPARTASTASALMIGLTLVTLVGVLAAGLRARFQDSVNQVFAADYALTSSDNFTPIGIAAANALRSVPGVETISGVRAGQGRAYGGKINVSGVSPDITKVVSLKWIAGGSQAPSRLGSDGALVSKAYAKAQNIRLGSPLSVQTPSGAVLHLRLVGIFDPPKGGSPFGDVTVSTALFDSAYPNPENVFTLVNAVGGVTAANTRPADRRAADIPGREDPDQVAVHPQPAVRAQHAPQPAVRAAVAVDHREPVRDRQHARADRVRAHARAGDAAGRRDDPPAGTADDPPGERDHRAARSRARDPARDRARAARRRRPVVPGVHGPGLHARRVRVRGGDRRPAGGDPAGAAGRPAQRAPRAPVRITAAPAG